MKKDLSKIHPELQDLARKSPAFSITRKNLWLSRLLMSLTRTPKPSDDILIQDIHIPNEDETVKIRLRTYKAKAVTEPAPVLLWLHGGGHVLGKPEMDDMVCVQYVCEAKVTVVSVDYRYAPEHPFPVGLVDSYTALKWIRSHHQQLGIDPQRIAVGGASAGGGLAAALAQLAYDREEVKPVFQLLVYPMLDDRTVLRSDIDDSNSPAWSQKSNRFGWEAYLGQRCGEDDVQEHSVPARRNDLSGLPPAWIGVGTLDVFYDEDVSYARRLQECGVECELNVVPGAFHGFDVFDHRLRVVQDFRHSQIASLNKYLFQR